MRNAHKNYDLKKIAIFAILFVCSFIAGAQKGSRYIQNTYIAHPQSDDTDAAGTYFWHNDNNNNWLSYKRLDTSGKKIQIVVIDYDRPNHPDSIFTLTLHLGNVKSSLWIVDTLTIQKYGKRNGKFFPLYRGDIDDEKFGTLTQKIMDRLKIWRKK